MIAYSKRRLHLAVMAASVATPMTSDAVRLGTDGHGQALIYPLYTARSTTSGNAYVTAVSVINPTASAKAVKVRFLEGKAGAEVLDFNLFLSQYDVWTAGIIAAGPGAGIFTLDNSCTTPRVSNSSASPTMFRNGTYVGDGYADTLDRTYEGYLEILEMGAIVSGSTLEARVTHKQDLSAPNASKPLCSDVPLTADVPAGLVKPSGGLMGNASFININDGTDVAIDAIALTQWSDSVQWSPPGSVHPNLTDATPAVSTVVDSRPAGDAMIVSRWQNGRDAVSAVLMTDLIRNDFTVEPAIKAATDWIVTMPTKRFYMNRLVGTAPFATQGAPDAGQRVGMAYFDREEQTPGQLICDLKIFCPPNQRSELAYATTTIPWVINSGRSSSGLVLGGRSVSGGLVGLNTNFINGWGEMRLSAEATAALVAPAGMSIVTDTLTGVTTPNVNVTYYGLPVVGFAAQSYSTTGLPGVNANVLSNYGGSFVHKVTRRIVVGSKG